LLSFADDALHGLRLVKKSVRILVRRPEILNIKQLMFYSKTDLFNNTPDLFKSKLDIFNNKPDVFDSKH